MKPKYTSTRSKWPLGLIVTALLLFTVLIVHAGTPPPAINSGATTGADNFDEAVAEINNYVGPYNVAVGGLSLHIGELTAGSFNVTIPSCTVGSPTIEIAYLTFYQRWWGASSLADGSNPVFDDDLSLNINGAGAQTVTVADTDGYWSRIRGAPAAGIQQTHFRRHVVTDITTQFTSDFSTGANTLAVSGLAVPTPDISNASVKGSSTFGIGANIVYECPEYENAVVSLQAGLDYFYAGGADSDYAGVYSGVACVTFPAAVAADTVDLEALLGGQSNASSPFRGARLWYQTGSGSPPTTTVSAPTDTVVTGGTQLGSGYAGVWISNLGQEWDHFSGTININASDTWACIQGESVDDPGTGQNSASIDISNPIFVVPQAVYDYGDAPESGTYSANQTTTTNAAYHLLNSELVLGTCVDSENDGNPVLPMQPADFGGGFSDDSANGTSSSFLPSPTACVGVDDEDGFAGVVDSDWSDGNGSLSVSVSGVADAGGSACVYAWIDFDQDGFDSGDATSTSSFIADATQTMTFSSNIPVGTIPVGTPIYVRLRVVPGACGTINPTGLQTGGEVEDHDIQSSSVTAIGFNGGAANTPATNLIWIATSVALLLLAWVWNGRRKKTEA